MIKKRVLFVDDEPNILMGLKRMLRSMRKEFDLQFAENGKEALAIMEDGEFDVVVSDMRMPGMDGAELLTKIQERYPYTIRIMLTGQANEDSIIRTVGVVHQFLAKPCDPEHLKEVLLRAVSMHELISHEALKKIISGIGSLPSLPEVYSKLRRAMVSQEVSVEEVGAIIEEDMAMSAKVLQLVNSAFFGLFQKVNSPARAVNLLGIDTVKGLVLGVGVFAESHSSSDLLPIKKLWAHSLAVGSCAKKIALSVTDNVEIVDHCFISGILHDIGKLVLLAEMPKQYEQVIELAEEKQLCLREAEKEIFAAVHCDIGAYLMGLWGMPAEVVEAIGFHHRLATFPGKGFSPALAVNVANRLYYENRPDELIGARKEIDINVLKAAGVDEKLELWREICADLLEQRENDE